MREVISSVGCGEQSIPFVIAVAINGEPRLVPENTSIAQLLALLGIAGEGVAVELDHAIVRRAAWEERVLSPGAKLEIVHFVGGG